MSALKKTKWRGRAIKTNNLAVPPAACTRRPHQPPPVRRVGQPRVHPREGAEEVLPAARSAAAGCVACHPGLKNQHASSRKSTQALSMF